MIDKLKADLHKEIEKLHERNELSKNVAPDYFNPGMMEYLEQSDGLYDAETGEIIIRFEVRGTRYEGRTELIEKLKVGDELHLVRDEKNAYNANNFSILTRRGQNVGNMPAELCNVIAPLYDANELMIDKVTASFVEPISKRSRHASKAVLFTEIKLILK